ncbi:MAG: hypothetical protein QOH57_267, partial [Mycobacterium sp.]|nr:hypothetical protein [Mycobacterium sp.]
LFEDDPQFWYETLRVFGHGAYGGSEFGEVLATATQIRPGDYGSWHDAWLGTADRVADEAKQARAGGHKISAREGYLRASTYYRMAEFFLHDNPDDPRIRHAYSCAVSCFRAAVADLDTAVEQVEIPYQHTVLHGYFYRAPGAGPHPTVIMHTGFDGSAEEMHFFGAQAGAERGYHVLSFDGPGQPSAIHLHQLCFRPDWEHVVSPVVDYLLATEPSVDPDRIALLGLSLGGVLAPRAAAFEPRLAALVAFDGIYDAATSTAAMLGLDRDELVRRTRLDHDGELDALLDGLIATSPTMRWAIGHGRFAMGASTPRAFIAAFLDYNLRDGVAERISCPTLVCAADSDVFFPEDGQLLSEPELLYQHLTCPKTLLRFTEVEGADAHCQVGAQRLAIARIYNWLDDTLKTSDQANRR